jgi:carboxyl-terminal processing protease
MAEALLVCPASAEGLPPLAAPRQPGESFMPIATRSAIASIGAAVLFAAAVLAGCAGPQPLPIDPTGRLFARGLDDIAEYYIAPISIRVLAIAGAERLPSLDRRVSVAESPAPGSQTDIVLAFGRHDVADLPEPTGEDPHAWGALLGRLVADARTVSPTVAALSQDRIDAAVFNGITSGLDRFSRYASPQAARDQRAVRDGFGGIGVTVVSAAGAFRVAAVEPGGPADRAGIRPGDRIVAIDGEPTGGRSEFDVVRQLRGPIATTVEVAIAQPRGVGRDLWILRALIVLPTVHLTRDHGIAVFRISSFNQDTAREFVHDLETALAPGQPPLSGIVLDLRSDPGGLLDQAVSLADMLIRRGPIVATTGRHPASRQLFEASGDGPAPSLPIVVLINGASASAAEVVAAALQDTGRAVVVGSASYGKGTVQTVIRLPNGGELTLTWALLLAPSGYLLNGHGVVPTLCTSDLGNDNGALRIALERADAASLPPLTQEPRAALSEADWARLRRSCPQRLGDPPIDMTVAESLLADPGLFAQAVHVLARTPKLAAAGSAPAGPRLTGGVGSLLSGSRAQ